MFNKVNTPYRNDILAFEDFLDIDYEDLVQVYTPGSIDRKVLTLDSAWQLLKRKLPDNSYIQNEVKAWETWSKDILDSSWFYKTLPTGIMDELDVWESRYKQAYLSVSDRTNLVKPGIVEDSILTKPYFWAVVGVGIGIGISLYLKR